jgi:glutamate-1-semialdehyde 2,1-aminomutase
VQYLPEEHSARHDTTVQLAIDRPRLRGLMEKEATRFLDQHPRSRELFERARGSLLSGVPMPWMTEWAGAYPVFVEEARGARFVDVDGHEYVDFCLGDTGAMAGHSPPALADAVAEQVRGGITVMLPSEDALWCGEELSRRFGLPSWQFALTATDANRFTIRLAREITSRPKVLVHAWCYHGSVDETFVVLEGGTVTLRPHTIGAPVEPAVTTRAVEINDLDGLERELAEGDVACVLIEPALTNIGIVLPEAGYHQALRDLTKRHGTLLVIDETHTICAGPGGYTRAYDLEPDFLTIGKTIGGGIPAAAYGFSEAVRDRILAAMPPQSDVGGVGGTLAGNVLSLAAIRVTLSEVLTEAAFAHMISLGKRFEDGVAGVISGHDLPWSVTRLGCRVEYWPRPEPARTGGEAAAAADTELDRFLHLFALNRGILMTPFHNMALMCPDTTDADVDRHTEVFEEAVSALSGRS